MPTDLNKLVLTAAQYKFFLTQPTGVTNQLLTLDSIDTDISVEEELIYAVGNDNAIANKRAAKKVTGKMSFQVGELFSILSLNGLVDATQIAGATLACATTVGGFNRAFSSVNLNRESISVKRKDKETLASIDFTALYTTTA